MSRLEVIDLYFSSLMFWMPYLLGFSTGGIVALWVVQQSYYRMLDRMWKWEETHKLRKYVYPKK